MGKIFPLVSSKGAVLANWGCAGWNSDWRGGAGQMMWQNRAGGEFHHFGGLGILLGIFFWIIVLLVIFALFKWAMHGRKTHEAMFTEKAKEKESPKESSVAMNILKERYAKGEIKKEEFNEKKKDLE